MKTEQKYNLQQELQLYIYKKCTISYKSFSNSLLVVVSSYISLPHVRCMLARDWSVIMLAQPCVPAMTSLPK